MGEFAPVPMRPREESKENIPKKKLEPVVTGSAQVKKKSELQKLADLFFYRDGKNVKSYIVTDVLVPSGKKALSDIAKNTVNMITDILLNSISMAIWGEPDRIGKGSSTASKVSYQKYYDRYGNSTQNDQSRQQVRTQSASGYSDIVFQNRGDAEEVLDRMREMENNHYIITVADVYELSDIKDNNYTNNKYGWTDISAAQIVSVREGFMLRLPKPMQID
jgi:hypothetical protein